MNLVNDNKETCFTIDGIEKKVFNCQRCGNLGFWDLYQIDGFFNPKYYLAVRLCDNCYRELKKQLRFFKKV